MAVSKGVFVLLIHFVTSAVAQSGFYYRALFIYDYSVTDAVVWSTVGAVLVFVDYLTCSLILRNGLGRIPWVIHAIDIVTLIPCVGPLMMNLYLASHHEFMRPYLNYTIALTIGVALHDAMLLLERIKLIRRSGQFSNSMMETGNVSAGTTERRKNDKTILAMLIHFATNLATQTSFLYITWYHDCSLRVAVVWSILQIVLVCIDFFVCNNTLGTGTVLFPWTAHLTDGFVAIPNVILIMEYFIAVFVLDRSDVNSMGNEIYMMIGLILVDTLMVILRLRLIMNCQVKCEEGE